jgi:NADPH:quinone reductase
MRAALVQAFGPIDWVTTEQVPAPVPGRDEALIDVAITPVNYVDLVMIAGHYQFLPPLPFIPGKGPTGVVSAVGPGVTGLRVGDRVLAMAELGGFAEKVAVAANQCHLLPDAMPYAHAASMSLAYDTAWFALRERARYVRGETVLVLGASGAVGLAGVQIAKALGARVLAGISRPENAGRVREAGADAVVDLSLPDLYDSLREQVRAANGGRLADIVLDPLGDSVFDAAIRAVDWCGRLVVIGFAAGRIPQVKVNYLLVKNIEVSGLQISDYRKRQPAKLARCFAELFALYKAGSLRPPEPVMYPLESVVAALTAVRDRTARGRVVLDLHHAAVNSESGSSGL